MEEKFLFNQFPVDGKDVPSNIYRRLIQDRKVLDLSDGELKAEPTLADTVLEITYDTYLLAFPVTVPTELASGQWVMRLYSDELCTTVYASYYFNWDSRDTVTPNPNTILNSN